jgi:signal transduction histidine kinase
LCLFRIVQESLTNILRHAESPTAAIDIHCDETTLTLAVRDHGKGMSPEKFAEVQSKGFGVGIRGMRERVRHFGGEMTFTSDSSGTTVFAVVPISNTPQHAEGAEPLHSAA